jgi:hypothetical protein
MFPQPVGSTQQYSDILTLHPKAITTRTKKSVQP